MVSVTLEGSYIHRQNVCMIYLLSSTQCLSHFDVKYKYSSSTPAAFTYILHLECHAQMYPRWMRAAAAAALLDGSRHLLLSAAVL